MTIHNLPCWTCNSSDACSYYSEDKHRLYCYSCGEVTFEKDIIEQHLRDNNQVKTRSSNIKKGKHNMEDFPVKGNILELEDRGITSEVARKFGVETYVEDTKKVARIFPFYDFESNLIAQKIKSIHPDRNGKKQMVLRGEPNKMVLFGQHLFPAGGKYLTITEGEEDALAAYQILQSNVKGQYVTPVVSIPNGVPSVKKVLQEAWEYLSSFENIVVCFDGDTQGRGAASIIADAFPLKVKVMKMTYKDANEYLKANALKSFVNDWYNAEKITPKGIIPSSALWGHMTAEEEAAIAVPYPWPKMNDMLYSMRTGELVVTKAFPKVGKTTFLKELAYHINRTSDHNVALILLEETRKRIGLGICGLHINRPLARPDAIYTLEELKKANDEVFGDDRFYVFDPQGDRSVDNVIEKITHFVKAYDCKFIFLDHVTMLSYNNINTDERRFLDKIFNDLKDLTVQHNIHIHVVTHVNDDGKTRGSRAGPQLCDVLLALKRDKTSEDKVVKNTTEVIVEDHRHGESGLATKLFYDHDTGRMTELDTMEDVKATLREVKFADDTN